MKYWHFDNITPNRIQLFRHIDDTLEIGNILQGLKCAIKIFQIINLRVGFIVV